MTDGGLPVNWWVRTKGIPPTIALFVRDSWGRLHQWRLELHDQWKAILMKAWSIRLIVFFALVEIVYDISPAFQDTVPLKVYVPIRALAVGLTILARVTKQKGVDE